MWLETLLGVGLLIVAVDCVVDFIPASWDRDRKEH